jgi:hypothetical protein
VDQNLYCDFVPIAPSSEKASISEGQAFLACGDMISIRVIREGKEAGHEGWRIDESAWKMKRFRKSSQFGEGDVVNRGHRTSKDDMLIVSAGMRGYAGLR